MLTLRNTGKKDRLSLGMSCKKYEKRRRRSCKKYEMTLAKYKIYGMTQGMASKKFGMTLGKYGKGLQEIYEDTDNVLQEM